MSLQDNVSYIKEEISNEEKFFESFFKLEKFYKKYKYIIFAVVGLAIIYFIASNLNEYFMQKNKTEANITYAKAVQNPTDEKLLETLKGQNEKLYEAVLFQQNKEIKNPSVKYFKELQTYKNAVKNKDIATLNTLIASQDFLLRDFAVINKALLEVEKESFAKAKTTLKVIDQNSAVTPLANLLNHYLLTK